MSRKLAYLYISVAACLWGAIGLFVSNLNALGFTPEHVVSIRNASAALLLVLYTLVKNREVPKIKLADSKYFVGTGIVSIVLFNWCMFNAIQETSISVATILLYTAPAFVTVLSRLLFREALTPRKMLALATTLAGCAFVVGILPGADNSVSLYGLLLGLGSGFFYALYSIFGKFALRRYDSLTVTVYTFIFAAVAALPLGKVWTVLPLFANAQTWLYIIGLSLFSTIFAFILYTKGLTVVETSRASIIATLEPVVASVISFFVFQEKLSFWQYVGIAMVIAAVIMVQELPKRRKERSFAEEKAV